MKPKAAVLRFLVGGAAYCAASSLLLLPLHLLLPSSRFHAALLSTPRPSARQSASRASWDGDGGGQGEQEG